MNYSRPCRCCTDLDSSKSCVVAWKTSLNVSYSISADKGIVCKSQPKVSKPPPKSLCESLVAEGYPGDYSFGTELTCDAQHYYNLVSVVPASPQAFYVGKEEQLLRHPGIIGRRQGNNQLPN